MGKKGYEGRGCKGRVSKKEYAKEECVKKEYAKKEGVFVQKVKDEQGVKEVGRGRVGGSSKSTSIIIQIHNVLQHSH